MHHFLIPSHAIEGAAVAFSQAQFHQIGRVLRLHDGDRVVALDGQGAQYVVELEVAAGRVTGHIVAPATACHEPAVRVTLLAAPPKGERWEWLLQKGTELGVARFAPVIARYSQPGTTAIKPRHREIVREATEQCRRLLLPRVEEPRPLAAALQDAARDGAALTVLLWEGQVRPLLAEALRPSLQSGVREIRLVIGPEGGFHPDEVAQARALGIAVAGLGPLILRAETAGLAAVAIALAL